MVLLHKNLKQQQKKWFHIHAPKFSQLMDHRTLIGGSLSYYYNTIIGPVGTTLGYSNKSKEVNMFFNIGYEF